MGFLDAGRQTYGSATNRLPCCRNGRRLNAKKRGQRVHVDQADGLASIAASDDGGRQMDLVRWYARGEPMLTAAVGHG